jgi:hypothetical protein
VAHIRYAEITTRAELSEYAARQDGPTQRMFAPIIADERRFQGWLLRRIADDLTHAAFKLRQMHTPFHTSELREAVGAVVFSAERGMKAVRALQDLDGARLPLLVEAGE